MQNSEKQKFEEQWKKTFDGAKMTPPDRVWNSIELDLAGQESATMKKRVVFYQRLAAATVLFALVSGIYAFYPRQEAEGSSKETVDGRQETVDGRQETVAENRADNRDAWGIDQKGTNIKSETTSNDFATNRGIVEINKAEPAATVALTGDLRIAASNTAMLTRALQHLPTYNGSALEPHDPSTENAIEQAPEKTIEENKVEDRTVAIASPLAQETESPEEIVEPKRKRVRENNLWVALGASAGNYSPNTPSATTPTVQSSFAPTLDALQAAQKAQPKVGTSYSFGLSVGKKFGRVVVQTGLSVNKQQVEYTSSYDNTPAQNTNSAKAASSDYLLADNSTGHMNFTAPYTVNSAMEIVSIPVQAGYMIVDRKLGWQLNAGVSPDFFIRNILVDESGQRERFTQSAGSASPYRSVNWSGLLNTELSYRIGTHYRISLVPGVRYSFNPILKESTDSGRPVILDVGFRFRYLFE